MERHNDRNDLSRNDALRDIKGKRLKLTPVDPNDIRTLINMGYVEMKNDEPVVTDAGLQQIEIGD